MPMVRHDAVRKKCYRVTPDGFFEHLFECRVVAGIVKEDGAFGCPVQYVKHQSRSSLSRPSRHDGSAEAILMPNRCRPSVLEK